MPIITVNYEDLISLIGKHIDKEELLEKIPMMGADIDRVDDDELAIEFFPDRPDLFSVEGVARALRSFLTISPGMNQYNLADPTVSLTVDRSVKPIRPFISAAVIRDIRMSEELVVSMMELQEKLHFTVGKERTKMAIGLHNMDAVTAPFTYKAVDPSTVSFIPLNETNDMDLDEILKRHEKGIAYAHILKDHKQYPVIVDKHDNVLSFPPIINGELTAIDLFTENIFIDVTGTDAHAVTIALTIIATALAERGGAVEAVMVQDELQRKTPNLCPNEIILDIGYTSRLLGREMSKDAVFALRKMGYDTTEKKGEVTVKIPPWRSDILHPIDLVEDVAIGYGYDRFIPRLPYNLTIGKRMSWLPIHDTMIGLGFNEVVTLSLSSQDDQFERMRLEETDAVHIANPLTMKHTLLRVSLIPSLLEIFSKNRHNELPQMIYEVGEAVWFEDDRPYNVTLLAGTKIDARAGFTECKSLVEAVLRNMNVEAEINESQHPSYIEGRCAGVTTNEKIGYFGELHPDVVTNYNLEYPVISFEFQAARLTAAPHNQKHPQSCQENN